MKNKTKFISLLIASALIALFASCQKQPEHKSVAGSVHFNIQLPKPNQPLRLVAQIHAGDSVIVAMRDLQKKNQLQFNEHKTNLGILIDSIAGIKNSKSGMAWVYTLNGKLAQTGVSQVILSQHDRIRWCYLKYAERNKCTNL